METEKSYSLFPITHSNLATLGLCHISLAVNLFMKNMFIVPQYLYLQWVFGANGQNLVLEVAELTAPGASLTDPADKAGLVGTAHGASTPTRAQQFPLQDTKRSCMGRSAFTTDSDGR